MRQLTRAILFLYNIISFVGNTNNDLHMLLIPTYCRVPCVRNTDNVQTAAAGQTGRTLKP